MFYFAGKTAAAFHYGLGAVAGGLGGIALQMLLDRDLRNELLQQGGGAKIHPQIISDAAKIAPLLKHLDPATARIGIGGLPRTGKSEMASELSRHLGMQHYDADLRMGLGGVPPGHVSDRYDTLVNQDPDQFDALLHMRRPGVAHGPASKALWDLHGLDEANKQQFLAAKGPALKPTETTALKLKPPGGFGTKALDQSFVNKGEVLRKAAPGILGSVAGLIAAHLLKK
jgi:hypothetical protein